MKDVFVLFSPGSEDSSVPGVVRLPNGCYEKVRALKARTGISMGRIIEQCIDFSLERMEGNNDGNT